MLSNSQAKYISSLSIKKFRLKHNRFLCEGTKIIEELLLQSLLEVELLAALPEWLQGNQYLLKGNHATIIEVTEKELKKISNLTTPNKVLAVVKMPALEFDKRDFADQLCLYLDDLQDPGNLGTILRIADWFDIKYVICSPFSVDAYNYKVIQASMGAFLRVKTMVFPLQKIKEAYPDKLIYGADMNGDDLFQTKLEKNAVIVIGNEGRGIKQENLNIIDRRLSIPAPKGGRAESLNAAVATGIICACFRNL